MNQAVKRAVYTKGTQEDIDYISKISGMTEEEKMVLQMWHDKSTDLDIQEEVSRCKNSMSEVEISVRIKTASTVLMCLRRCRELDEG